MQRNVSKAMKAMSMRPRLAAVDFPPSGLMLHDMKSLPNPVYFLSSSRSCFWSTFEVYQVDPEWVRPFWFGKGYF